MKTKRLIRIILPLVMAIGLTSIVSCVKETESVLDKYHYYSNTNAYIQESGEDNDMTTWVLRMGKPVYIYKRDDGLFFASYHDPEELSNENIKYEVGSVSPIINNSLFDSNSSNPKSVSFYKYYFSPGNYVAFLNF